MTWKFIGALLGVLIFGDAALAQGQQVPNHSIPIGRGPGVTGFNSAAPGTMGQVLTSNGTGSDPTFQPASPAGVPLSLCTGLTDQTTYVQTILNSGAKAVFVPSGLVCSVTGITPPGGVAFQIGAGAFLRKFGTSGAKLITIGGDQVSILGPGTIDGNNVSTFAMEPIFCDGRTVGPHGSAISGLVIDGITFINAGTFAAIHLEDCTKFTINNNTAYDHGGVYGLVVLFFYSQGDLISDVRITNNRCSRTASGSCFDVFQGAGETGTAQRFIIYGNDCLGDNTLGTAFQSCVQSAISAQHTTKGWTVFGNTSRYQNYAFSMEGLVDSSVFGNIAREVGSNGFCLELSSNVNTTWSNNICSGGGATGALALINGAVGTTFTGNVLTGAAGAQVGIVYTPSGTPVGAEPNVISSNIITMTDGKAIAMNLLSNNVVITGNILNGKGTATTAIDLATGTGRVVTSNVAIGFTGIPIINIGPTDVVCGNNVLGCNAATANSSLLEYKSSVNFNAANTDTAFSITLPPGITRYRVSNVAISGASASLTTATAGVFTATGGGGVAIVAAASAITVSTAADATNNNTQSMAVINLGTESYTAATLYFRVATAQGSPATGTVTISIVPLS